VEQLSEDLLIFAYALGALCFICAALFALDLMFFKNLLKLRDSTAQTDQSKETVALKVYNLSQEPKMSCCNMMPRTHIVNESSRNYLRTDLYGNLFYFEGKSKNDVLESNAPFD